MLALPLLLVLSSCNAGQSTVATVDGRAISGEHFVEGAALYAELVNNAQMVPPKSDDLHLSTTTTAAYAYFLIQNEAFASELRSQKIEITAAERSAAEKNLEKQFPGGPAPAAPTADGKAAVGKPTKKFGDYPAWFRTLVVDFEARIEVLSARTGASPENVAKAKAFYDANRNTQFASWCLDVLVTNSQDSATAARARLVGGEDFSTVAKEVAAKLGQTAVGNQADGDAGCDAPSSWQTKLGPDLVTALSKLAPGGLTAPFEVQAGTFVVVKLRSSTPQPFEQVRAQLEDQVGQQELNARLGKRLAAMRIEVNPKYGIWSAAGGQFKVVPPAGAEHTTPASIDPTMLGGGGAQSPAPAAG